MNSKRKRKARHDCRSAEPGAVFPFNRSARCSNSTGSADENSADSPRPVLQVYGDGRDFYLTAPIRGYGDPREIYLA